MAEIEILLRTAISARARTPVQEALLAAATQWPAEGVPDNPRGWPAAG